MAKRSFKIKSFTRCYAECARVASKSLLLGAILASRKPLRNKSFTTFRDTDVFSKVLPATFHARRQTLNAFNRRNGPRFR